MINEGGITRYARNARGDALTKFGTMAIGSGSTAEAAGDTQLVSEHTTGGAERKAATVTLEGSNLERLRFTASFAFTEQLIVREVNITDDEAPLAEDTGTQLLRQVFLKNYAAIPGDTITLEVDSVGSDATVQPTGATIVVTWNGIEQAHRLVGRGLTDSNGPWTALALGRDDTAPDADDAALGDEIVAGDDLNLGRGEGSALSVTNVSTNGFVDTVRLFNRWAIETVGTPSVDVDEVSIETSLTVGSGVMPARMVFDDPLSLEGLYQDTYEHTFDYVFEIA